MTFSCDRFQDASFQSFADYVELHLHFRAIKRNE